MISIGDLARQPPGWLSADLDRTGHPRRPVVVVDTDGAVDANEVAAAVERARWASAVVVAVTRTRHPRGGFADVADVSLAVGDGPGPSGGTVGVADPLGAAARLQVCVERNPVASLTLAWLLRGQTPGLSVRSALAQESAAYSALLAGSEFASWLARRRPPRVPDGRERLKVSRDGQAISVVLDRVARRNAVDAAMRDALVEALELVEHDGDSRLELSGNGPCFSAGGDLDEFGSAGDVALAHVIRTEASVGAVLHRIRDRATVRVHGVCIGAGVELPAFASRVIAQDGTWFALPDVGMGLIPGAGGTVSIPRRIGRQRALWLALTGERIPARTALTWGLVDDIE